MAPLWKIEYYVAEDGSVPFWDFIRRLTTLFQKAECKAFIEHLRKRGNTLHGDKYLPHANNLREIKGESVRIFYACGPHQCVIVFGGLLPGDADELFDAIRREAERYASYKD